MTDWCTITNEVLYRLLYHDDYRDRFFSDTLDLDGLPTSVREGLSAIDREQLARMSEHVHRSVLRGGSGDGDGILSQFPMTFARLCSMGITEDEVGWHFLRSEAFRDYSVVPFAGVGICLPEAFHRCLTEEEAFTSLHDASHALIRHEFLTSIMSLLTVHRRPSFAVRSPLVQRNDVTWYALPIYDTTAAKELGFAVRSDDGDSLHVLYAAGSAGLVVGPVPPFVEGVLSAGSCNHEIVSSVASVAGVDESRVSTFGGRLRSVGLIR